MSYQKDREAFLATMAREGMDLETARLILRDATTIQRWEEEECNGTIQVDDDDEKAERVSRYGSGESYREHRYPIPHRCNQAKARIRKRMPQGFAAVFQGDPRGACVKIKVPSGKYDDWGREGVCVPTRG